MLLLLLVVALFVVIVERLVTIPLCEYYKKGPSTDSKKLKDTPDGRLLAPLIDTV